MEEGEKQTPFQSRKKLHVSPAPDRAIVNKGALTSGGESSEIGGAKETSHSQPSSLNSNSQCSRDVTESYHDTSQQTITSPDRKHTCHEAIAEKNLSYKNVNEENSRIIIKLQEFLLNAQAKQISKTAVETVLAAARKLEDNCNKLIIENAELNGEIRVLRNQAFCPTPVTFETHGLETLKLVMKDIINEEVKPLVTEKVDTTKKQSYASTLVGKRQETPIEPPSSVYIAQTDLSREKYPTVQELKQGIKKSFTPAKEGIKIRGLVETTRGVIIRTQTKEEATRLAQSERIKELGAKVNLENKRLPRIIIYDVPSDLEQEKIVELFWTINAKKLDPNKQHFSLVFKTGPRGRDTVHWVAEVSPAVRNEILAEGRVFLDWSSCNVRDWVAVTRCNKCQGFSHIEKFCPATVVNCGYCSERGHVSGDCPKQKTGGPPKCINCSKTNSASNHPTNDKDCPSYKRAIERLVMRTKYNDNE